MSKSEEIRSKKIEIMKIKSYSIYKHKQFISFYKFRILPFGILSTILALIFDTSNISNYILLVTGIVLFVSLFMINSKTHKDTIRNIDKLLKEVEGKALKKSEEKHKESLDKMNPNYNSDSGSKIRNLYRLLEMK